MYQDSRATITRAMRASGLDKVIRDEGVRFLSLQFTDIVGRTKSVTMPASQVDVLLRSGIWFDGSSVEGLARVSESDMLLVPDLETFVVVPWSDPAHRLARVICDIYTPDRQLFAGAPRSQLVCALERAAELGFAYRVAPEVEFFLLPIDGQGRAATDDVSYGTSHMDASTDEAAFLWREVLDALDAFGIGVEAEHHEVGPGQHQIDLQGDNALRMADHTVTARNVIRALARRQGLHATFMPKPVSGVSGSGFHVHQSLLDVASGRNLFADGEDAYGLSRLARAFVAGQLAHARGMMAVLAPLVNSYKRLGPRDGAPAHISWGRGNRSTLIRVPRCDHPEDTRIELRCADPSCNPYLAFAVTLECGLDGIVHELKLPEPTGENLFDRGDLSHRSFERLAGGADGQEQLPNSLRAALDELAADDVVQQALGPHITQQFLKAKGREWEDYRLEVTPWEWQRAGVAC